MFYSLIQKIINKVLNNPNYKTYFVVDIELFETRKIGNAQNEFIRFEFSNNIIYSINFGLNGYEYVYFYSDMFERKKFYKTKLNKIKDLSSRERIKESDFLDALNIFYNSIEKQEQR